MSPPVLRQRLLRDMDGLEGSRRQYSPRSRSISPVEERKYSSRSRNNADDDDRSEISDHSPLPPRKEKLNIKNSHSRASSYDGSDVESREVSERHSSKSHMKLNRSPSPETIPLSHSQSSSMYQRSDADMWEAQHTKSKHADF